MKYIVEYKISYISGYNRFPILHIRYRRENNLWNHRMKLDLDCQTSSSAFFNVEHRLVILKEYIKDYHNENIDSYVTSIVRGEIMSKTKIDNLEIELRNLVTDGWKHIEFEIDSKKI